MCFTMLDGVIAQAIWGVSQCVQVKQRTAHVLSMLAHPQENKYSLVVLNSPRLANAFLSFRCSFTAVMTS